MSDPLVATTIASSVSKFLRGNRTSRTIPEPASSLAKTFGGVLRTVGKVVDSGQTVGIDPEYRELIETQMEFQRQMQLVSLRSNIEKSRHESRMAAIRNVRTA